MEKIDLAEKSKALELELLKKFDVEYLSQIVPPDDDKIRRQISFGIYNELKNRVSRNLARFDCYFTFYNETDWDDAIKSYIGFLSNLDQDLEGFLSEDFSDEEGGEE